MKYVSLHSTHGNMESETKYIYYVAGFKCLLFCRLCVVFACLGKTTFEELISFKRGADGELISSKSHSWASENLEVSC